MGEIAGATVGGIAGVALSTAFILWYFRRRRRLAEPQPSTFDLPEPNLFVNFYVRGVLLFLFSASIVQQFDGKYHLTCQDPSDPSTFPRPFVASSATMVQTTSSAERVYNAEDRSRYPGLPLV